MRDKSADSSNGEPKNSKSAAGDTGEEELEDARGGLDVDPPSLPPAAPFALEVIS